MNPKWTIRAALLLGFLTVAAMVGANLLAISKPWEEGPIPSPPLQDQPWKAPETSLPRFIVTAAAALYQDGLSDPRDCELREVEIDQGRISTHREFVLPKVPGDPRRFAIGWDGVLHRVSKVGERVDLATETAAMIEVIQSAPARRKEIPWIGESASGFWDFRVGEATDSEIRGPLVLIILLRLGRADLAEAVFQAATPWKPGGPDLDLTDYDFDYLQLSENYAHALYYLGVMSHQNGDDPMAFDIFRRLDRFTRSVVKRADALGFARTAAPRSNPSGQGPPYFPGLEQLPGLIAFHTERVAGSSPSLSVAEALCDDLANTSRSSLWFRGGNFPSYSTQESALLALGEIAVEPLIEILEHDRRLTRIVQWNNTSNDVPKIIEVYEVAYEALLKILDLRGQPEVQNWDLDTLFERKIVADAIRLKWKQRRGR